MKFTQYMFDFVGDCFCTGLFVMVTLNLTCQHCLQHFFLKLLSNLFLLFLFYENIVQHGVGNGRPSESYKICEILGMLHC